MSDTTLNGRIDQARARVRSTAEQIRHSAHDLLESGSEDDDPDAAVQAADALAALSRRLEDVAEGARRAGLKVRDRGRDGARALERGERTLREGGVLAGAARAAFVARRNAGTLALGGAALLGVLLWVRQSD